MGGQRRINFESVSNTTDLMQILDSMNDEFALIRALINELADDRTTINAFQDEVVIDIGATNTDMGVVETLINSTKANYNKVQTLAEELRVDVDRIHSHLSSDQPYLNTATAAGLVIKAGGNVDAKTVAAIRCRIDGMIVDVGIKDPTPSTADGDTVTNAKHGNLVIFADASGDIICDSMEASATHASAIASYAEYSRSTNVTAMLAGNVCVPIGLVHILANVTSPFTWGTTPLDTDTDTYFDFITKPGIHTKITSLALDAGTSTFTYGGGVVQLGTGGFVTLTGKANVASEVGTAVATTKTGLWAIYALADDVEIAIQIAHDYANVAAANAAILTLRPNPYLPMIGWFTVDNQSAGNWTMGTENFDDADITSTFTITEALNSATYQDLGANALHPFPKVGAAATAAEGSADLTNTVTVIGSTVSLDPSAPNVTSQIKSGT